MQQVLLFFIILLPVTYLAKCWQRHSLAPLFPKPHQQIDPHAAQQNSKQHLFKKKSPRSLLSKPKQTGLKTPEGRGMRVAAFPSVPLPLAHHRSDSFTVFYLQILSGNYFYKVCKNEHSFITVSVFYFASFYHKGFWRDCKFPKCFSWTLLISRNLASRAESARPRDDTSPREPTPSMHVNGAVHKSPHPSKKPYCWGWHLLMISLNCLEIPRLKCR